MASTRRAPAAPIGGASDARRTLVSPVSGSAARTSTDLSGLASGLVSAADRIRQNDVSRDNLVAAKEQEAFKRITADAVAQLDPLDPEYTKRVEEIYKTATDSSMQNAQFSTSGVSAEFAASLEIQTTGGKALAEAGRRKALDEQGIILRGQVEDEVYANIRRDPDGFDAYLQEFAKQATRVNSSINPIHLPKLNEKFADTAVLARAQGYAEQGRFDEAKKLLDGNQNLLSPEDYRNGKRIIREEETRQRQDRLSSTASKAADLEIKIIDANTTDDFTRLRNEVETLDRTGFFAGREDKKVSMIRQIEHKREVVAREQNYIAVRLEQYDRGVGLGRQEDADIVWEKVAERFSRANPEATPNQWVDQAGQFAARSGWVPSQYRNLMANAERTDNVELIETSARLYDRFRTLAPEADTGTRDRGSRVRLVSATRELLGLPYGQAAQFILDRAPDENTLKARQKKFDEEFKGFDSRKALVGAGIAQDGWFSSPDAVPEPVARAYERTLRLHYDLVGDKGIAEAAANRRFKEEYGTSKVGGQGAVVRFPPENFFPGAANTSLMPDQKARIVNADVERSLKSLGIEPAIVVSSEYAEMDDNDPPRPTGKKIVRDSSGIPPYQLAADSVTEQDLASGRPASYELRVRNNFGVMVPVPVDNKGVISNLRYTMPTIEQLQKDPTFAEIAKQAEKDAFDKKVRNRVIFGDNPPGLAPDMSKYPYGQRKK